MHLHTPLTKKNDQYNPGLGKDRWDVFYETINKYVGDGSSPTQAIAVIAITDYLAIDNYFTVKNDKRLPACVMLCIPCIEMRMVPIAKEKPVNFHVFFSPDIDHEIEARFLSKLILKVGGRPYSATKADLISLGRAHANDASLPENEAYSIGIEQFVVTPEMIANVFMDDQDLRTKSVTAVSNKRSDGASGIIAHSEYFTETGSQLEATRQRIYQLSDMILSPNPSDISYFLGEGKTDDAETVKHKCGSLKPCIHGSDAHSYDKIFRPTEDRFCWIKADPTFEGFKQVLYEPKDRVHIGANIPGVKQGYNVIDFIEIIDNNDFSQKALHFSDYLTCIIGGKSTGKSLLLHNIAEAIDPVQTKSKKDIATNKIRPISGLKVHWKDGQVDHNDLSKTNPRKIVYIPQTYLNRLSDEKEETTEIDRIIQDIVLQNKDARVAFDSREETVENYKKSLAKNILDIISLNMEIKTYIAQRKEIGDKDGIENEIKKIKEEITKLSYNSNITDEDMKKYQDAQLKLNQIENHIKTLQSEIDYINKLDVIFSKNDIRIEALPLHGSTITQIIDTIHNTATSKWNEERKSITASINTKINDAKSQTTELSTITMELKPLVEGHAQVFEQTKLLKIENEKLEKIKAVNEKIDITKEKLKGIADSVAGSFSFFKSHYEAYASKINENVTLSSQGLDFRVEVVFKTTEFSAKIQEIFNKHTLTHFSAFAGTGEIKEEVLTKNVLYEMIVSLLSDEEYSLKPKGANTQESILRDVFSDFYNINHIVKMDDDIIYNMSPGKKALVLLKLLISLAESDCPILIDQPEDDLDNRSIFNELIGFIKSKKNKRQMIVVTHNANIVLGGDAELVIVANQHGNDSPMWKTKFEYRAGAIEQIYPGMNNDGSARGGILNKCGIQKHICEILEGGEMAFDLRKNKYRFIK